MFGGMLNPATHYAGKYLHVKSTQGCSAQRSLQARSRRPSRTKGSRRDRVTPSRVSQTIRVLETRVGGKLFDRTSRRVRLTPLGERLRDDAAPAYEELYRAYAKAHEIATGVAGTLRLGMYTPVTGGPYLLEIVKTFQTRHPDCRVQLIETGFARDQLDWLRHDEADLLAMRLPFNHADVVIGPILSREGRVVLVAEDDPLAERTSV